MKLSARNQLEGTVRSVTEGAVNPQVVIALEGGQEIVAVITLESAQHLGLEVGKRVKAVVKASDVMVGVE